MHRLHRAHQQAIGAREVALQRLHRDMALRHAHQGDPPRREVRSARVIVDGDVIRSVSRSPLEAEKDD